MERRLAAMLSADVVGYGRPMSEDEAGTLATLEAHRAPNPSAGRVARTPFMLPSPATGGSHLGNFGHGRSENA